MYSLIGSCKLNGTEPKPSYVTYFTAASGWFSGAYHYYPWTCAGCPDGSDGRVGEGDYSGYPAVREHVFQSLEPDTQTLLVGRAKLTHTRTRRQTGRDARIAGH